MPARNALLCFTIALAACGDATERDADGSATGDAAAHGDGATGADDPSRDGGGPPSRDARLPGAERDAQPGEGRDARMSGVPLPPYDGGPPIEQPCADGIVRATVLAPPRVDILYPYPVLAGDGAFVMMADFDQDGPCADPAVCGRGVYGRLTRADARTGELLWTTVVSLPLTVFTNPPMTVGIRNVGADGWEVCWAQTRGGWLAATVRFDADGIASEPVPIEDAPGRAPLDLRGGAGDSGGFLLTARDVSEELLLIRIADGASTSVVLDLESARSSWGSGGGQSELSSMPDGRVLGLFRERAVDDGRARLVTTIIDPADIGADRPMATLDMLESLSYGVKAVATSDGTVVGSVSGLDATASLDLVWLDHDLRVTGSESLDRNALLLGVSGALPAQALTLLQGPGSSLAFALASAPGALVGGTRAVGTLSGVPDTLSATMWSSAPGVHHLAYWQDALEVWTFTCGDEP
ncbi:MAG: hypothetical protein IT379_26635 [Deltaproteobacteria bacterium]|nr:hypothetical protein [Deltaproteobacteria bacterium]